MSKHSWLIRAFVAFSGVVIMVFSVVFVDIPAHAATCSRAMVASSGCTGAQARTGSVDIWASLFKRANPAPKPVAVRRVSPPVYRAPARPVYRAPVPVAPVSISQDDLASFSPQIPVLQSQPRGWSVISVPTNFYSPTQQHTVSGTLLGEAVEVRFTPVAFTWNFGDGTLFTSQTGGATWQQLSQKEFTPTVTSHVYASEGNFQIILTTNFSVEYRWADEPWQSIPGQVSSSSAPLSLTVTSANTVLVTGPCGNNRSARGC